MSKKKKKDDTPKKASAKTSKKKAKVPNEKKASSSIPKISRYRQIQKILSDYCKANGKKLGKKFNAFASEIARKTADSPIKQIQNNFDAIYLQYVESTEVEKTFPNDFPFFEFADKLNSDPVFDGVVIGIRFNDGTMKFEFKGMTSEVLDYYRFNMHRYLRVNYNESPYAFFSIEDTDGKTFVDYEIITDRTMPSAPTGGGGGGKGKEEKPKEEEEEEVKEVPTTPSKPPAGDKEVEIAKARAEEEKGKAVAKALQMLDEGKITQEQFDKILKVLGT